MRETDVKHMLRQINKITVVLTTKEKKKETFKSDLLVVVLEFGGKTLSWPKVHAMFLA